MIMETGAMRIRVQLGVLAVLLTAAGCASTPPPPAPPTTTLERIKATKTINLGYRDSSVPFSFVGPGQKPSGYSVDLCQQVVEDLKRDLQLPDLTAKWTSVTVDSRVAALQNGTIDLECGSTTKRSLKAAMEKAGTSVQLVPVKDHADGRTALEQKTADAYASDREILIGLALTAKDPAQFALLDRYFSYEPYALMMRRGDPDFRIAVNRSLARLYRTGDIIPIYQRWLGALGAPGAIQLATW